MRAHNLSATGTFNREAKKKHYYFTDSEETLADKAAGLLLLTMGIGAIVAWCLI